MSIVGSKRFIRFFRISAGLDVDKSDRRRWEDFVNRKIYDLLLRAEAVATANGRDIIQPFDLPITKGLQENIHQFRKLDSEIDFRSIIDRVISGPPLDLAYSEETDAKLPECAGGLSVALGHSFKIIKPDLKNPQTEHWERTFRIFDLLI